MADALEVASPDVSSAGSAVPAQRDCRAARLHEFFTSREQSRSRLAAGVAVTRWFVIPHGRRAALSPTAPAAIANVWEVES